MPDADRPARGVLITRPEPGASETARRVAAMGYDPVVAPALDVRRWPLRLPQCGRFQAILVTSGNALASLPSECRDLPLLAVGNATAAAARRLDFRDVRGAGGDAARLAELAQRCCTPERGPLLLACGQGQALDLAGALRAVGFRVIRRIAYVAEPVSALSDQAYSALAQRSVSVVLFFSAETARRFAVLVERAGLCATLRGVDALAIGRPAAMALGRLPWRCIRIARQPTQDEMLALLR